MTEITQTNFMSAVLLNRGTHLSTLTLPKQNKQTKQTIQLLAGVVS